MNHGINITCGNCGKSFPAFSWFETPNGPLPANQFQCPGCEIKIQKISGKLTSFESGGEVLYLPNEATIIEVCE